MTGEGIVEMTEKESVEMTDYEIGGITGKGIVEVTPI